jgi:hypothetical protein
LKPAQANSLRDPILKILITKRAQGESPEFKPQYHKEKYLIQNGQSTCLASARL